MFAEPNNMTRNLVPSLSSLPPLQRRETLGTRLDDTSVGQRKNRNRNHDLPNTGWALYPLSYENSWRTRSFN